MCYKVKCDKCSKWTWAGCGAHIDAALRGVPMDQRCCCRGETWGTQAPLQKVAIQHEEKEKPAAHKHEAPAHDDKVYDAKSWDDFQEKLKAHPKVLVDFYGCWCTACKALAPHVHKLAAETKEVFFMQCECSEKIPEAQDKYDIGPLPTVKFFHKGEPVEELTVEGKLESAITKSLSALVKK